MEMCRACLQTGTEMIPLDEHSSINYNLFTNLDVKLCDGLPQYFCKECLEALSFFMTFRSKAISSERSLREIVENLKCHDGAFPFESKVETDNQTFQTEIKTEISIKREIIEDFFKEEQNITDDNLDDPFDEDSTIELRKHPSHSVSASQAKTPKTTKEKSNSNGKINTKSKKKLPAKHCKELKTEKYKKIYTGIHVSCGICKKKLDVDAMKNHLETHKNSRKCEICYEDSFISWQQLFGHRIDHLPAEEKKCHICGRHYVKSFTLEYHYLKVHSGDQKQEIDLQCKICLKSYKNPIKLRKHISSVHTAIKCVFVCDYCSKRCKSKSCLRHHIVSHMNIKAITCEFCEFSCNFRSNLKDHMIRKHSPEKVTCRKCLRVFKTQEDHDKHTSTCNVTYFVCPVCGKKMNSTTNFKWKRHMRTHDPEPRYKCERCPKKYRTKQALRVHLSWHDGNPAYTCLYCPQRFYSLSSRIKHHRIHTGEKPYVCEICEKGFGTNTNLKMHMKVHGLFLINHKNKNPVAEDVNEVK